MVIEKFLALSMIALGLTASSGSLQETEADTRRAPRPFRRRVRWLRQHLQPRAAGGGAAVRAGRSPDVRK